MIHAILAQASSVPGITGPVLPHLPAQWELSLRLILAAFLGGLIGLERELNDHPSGLRTHIAVAIGAALFGIVSAYAWTDFIALRADNNYQVDVTRVAAQVVTGVGFLGGGAIIKQGNNIRGLTSAAGLWVSSAIGLAAGVGLYLEASVATLALLLALVCLKPFTRWLRHRVVRVRETIVVSMPSESDPSTVIAAVSALESTVIKSIDVKKHEAEGILVISVEIEIKGAGLLGVQLQQLEAHPGVLSVELLE